jgi:hypothetical protein
MTSNRWARFSIFSLRVSPLFLGISRCPEAEVGATGSEVASNLVDGGIFLLFMEPEVGYRKWVGDVIMRCGI